MGLLRTSEESRPLVLNTPSPTSSSMHTISDGYVNEGICDPDKIISSKFGDSCRKSLTSVLDKSYKDSCEFDLKKHFLRETNSGKFHTFFSLIFLVLLIVVFWSLWYVFSDRIKIRFEPKKIFMSFSFTSNLAHSQSVRRGAV